MDKKNISLGYRKKSAARLAAVQTLYDMEISKISAKEALQNCQYYKGKNLEDEAAVGSDTALLTKLVEGVTDNQEMIDTLISSCLTADWKIGRLDKVLLSILRAGIGELYLFPEVKQQIILSEYVEVSRAFYDEKEPGLVNAILQKAADQLRP
ncbi:MAG: transcription antitermination factor NusB [Alphaproteobacteria bacterium]